MRILLTGRRGFDYNRVVILLRGLALVAPDDHEVYEFGARDRRTGAELRRRAAGVDLVYVPPFRHLDVAWVKRHVSGKPVLFDPLIGTYITRVIDFGWWWRAPLGYLRDRRHFGAADHLVFDTASHREWAIAEFGLSTAKVHTLHIGTDTTLPGPEAEVSDTASPVVTVGFYGSLVPLQGADVILEAARRLSHREDIHFELIGNFDEVPKLRHFLKEHPELRITRLPYLSYGELERRVSGFDICLGIFGPSLKADVVIPNKVWHYAALGKPIISRDTPAMREVFADQATAYLLPGRQAQPLAGELAAAITRLVDEPRLRADLGNAAAELVRSTYTEAHVARNFLAIAESVIRNETIN